MAGFDPDVFGSAPAVSRGFDPDVFGVSAPKRPTGTAEQRIANDDITKGARSFAGEGSDALGGVSQGALNLLAGAVRGAGSIGATIARPFESSQENDARRVGIDKNMQSMGAQPDSFMYGAGKLGGEIAGTAGAGGVLANGVRLAAPAVTSMNGLNTLSSVARGLETGGFRVGGLTGPAALATRAGTGGVVGGVSAGMANPEEAGAGAAFGGALPSATQIAGVSGRAVRNSILGNTQPNSRKLDTARQSIDAGYVIPPNMIEPSLKNQVVESISGKQATLQIASLKNNEVTEGLVRQALGLPDDAQLTQATMENLRKTAGKAYAEVSALSPQASADLEALKTARNESQGWFKSYNRSASPDDLAKAKQFRADADNLENWLEFHAAQAGKSELIPALRDARKEIAKTYTVGRALNDASGSVDARILGRMHEKGLPLSDGLEVAGQFASAFPTISKTAQQVGSPAAHNLKSFGALMAGGGGAGLSTMLGLGGAASGGIGLAAGALPFLAPPGARSIMFSKAAQRGLLSPKTPDELGLLTQGAYRSLPLLLGQ